MKYKDDSCAISFPVAVGKTFPIGASVVLNSTGQADTPTTGENVIGIVSAIDPDVRRVTVATYFLNVVKGKASAGITVGTLVAENYLATGTSGIPTYIPATAGNYAVGIALNTAGINGDVEVGIYEVPLRKS